jgi:hypothetical protein
MGKIAPWFEEAAQMSRENPNQCFGVHMGIIGEWQGYRWRSVYSEIRSLVDEDGFLWPSPAEFRAHNPNMDQLEKEFTARINLARKKGVKLMRHANLDHYETSTVTAYGLQARSQQPGSTNGCGNGMNRRARKHDLVSADFWTPLLFWDFLGW